MRRALVLLASLVFVGCAGTRPGTGWTHAPDLSVYAAMSEYAEIAREQEILCQGFNPYNVTQRWDREYGGRQQAVAAALAARHGAEAVGEAEAADVIIRRVPCRDVPDDYWHLRYARLLRLLEVRLTT